MKRFLKYPQYIFEAFLLHLFFFLLKILPQKFATKLVTSIIKFVSKFHGANRIAYDNLKNAFPEKSEQEIKNITIKCWENLGIIGAEFDKSTSANKETLEGEITFVNKEYLTQAKEASKSIIYVSAHIGNWELASRMLIEYDPNTALIYRKAKNPFVENLIQKCRKKYANKIIPKGEVAGFKDILKQLKSGGSLGLLTD